MNIFVSGLNFRTASIGELERTFINKDELEYLLTKIKNEGHLDEIVLLSTCNRVEIFGVTNIFEEALTITKNFFQRKANISDKRLGQILYTLTNEKAVEHLFRIASSLDSMVVGEPQILGQVKEAYLIAKSVSCTGKIFNHIFPKAFQIAKKVRTDTDIGKNSVSIASVAVQLAKGILSDLSEKLVLLVGAGEMAEQAALNLSKIGIKRIYVFNRSESRAIELSNRIDLIPIYDFDQALVLADIVISSTSSEYCVINREDIMRTITFRQGRPLFLIDLAVPRDIDPTIKDIENVYLFNIDSLKEIAEDSKEEREKAANQAEAFIGREVSFFYTWLNVLEMKPLIENLKIKIETLCKEEIDESLKKLGHRDVNGQMAEWFSKSLAKKILHDPITVLKKNALSGENHYIEFTRHLFKLD